MSSPQGWAFAPWLALYGELREARIRMRPDFCPQEAPSLVEKREPEAAQKIGSVERSPIRAWQTWGGPPPQPPPTSHGFSLSLSLLVYKMGIIIPPSRGHAESFREKKCAWHRSAWEPALFIVCWHISHPDAPPPPPSALESHCRTSCQLGFQEGSCGLPSPTAQPPSVAAAALCWLGTCSGKVKAMLPLAVIGDDNSILSLVETGRDQSRHKGAAATGRNAPANATNYRKLAALRTITIQGCPASPVCPSGSFLTAGVRASHRAGGKAAGIPRVSMDHDQASKRGLLARRQAKVESGNVLWAKKKQGSWKSMLGREGELWRPVRRRPVDSGLSHTGYCCAWQRGGHQPSALWLRSTGHNSMMNQPEASCEHKNKAKTGCRTLSQTPGHSSCLMSMHCPLVQAATSGTES
ncbi:uncharacterized protein LOC125104943 [Lutra lutra]|uniref:uncharacterized protein LOC125104943 n=1 Tax=Lutra lutra TaxID=9657 RepID=UPI001FD10740|nr:uncharacterized protein LOC125104943 [Lutra lutra]XP_047593836.1 uncharacterized protein LOC125104943 [Lutra lutra]